LRWRLILSSAKAAESTPKALVAPAFLMNAVAVDLATRLAVIVVHRASEDVSAVVAVSLEIAPALPLMIVLLRL
jgi:hypothetical protein